MQPSDILCVFNPEHDLCLANGDRNFVPPSSAMEFARTGGDVMRILYGDSVDVIDSDNYSAWRKRQQGDPQKIIAWGWDSRLKQTLLKQGVQDCLLPSDEQLSRIRELQHRKTILPLQPQAWCVYNSDEVRECLTECGRVVLKAPWSGSGRGLRWVDKTLSGQDEAWIAKTVASQRCVIVEKRQDIAFDFALEFNVSESEVEFVGLSLFKTQSGVYRGNILISDDEIRLRLELPDNIDNALRQWLQHYVAPYYNGPVGIDMFKNVDGEFFVCEMNLRHTMGQVAHRLLQICPELHGSCWSPVCKNIQYPTTNC